MKLDEITTVHLANVPTALEETPRLAKKIGLGRLFIKRDDTTGLAVGGNKARKLEFLMADAQAAGTDIVLTCGGPQSNHARMTAAAARKLGMDSILFLTGPKPDRYEGNLLLDSVLGAEMRFVPNVGYDIIDDVMGAEAKILAAQGRVPYVIPVGGSTPVGALGYVRAAREVAGQLSSLGIADPVIVIALGSGGTLGGLTLGCRLFLPKARPVGISVSRDADGARKRVIDIATRSAKLLDVGFEPELGEVQVYDQYIGEAYGIPTPEANEAILLAARTEGIILDPVYTGKAMSGLIDLVMKGKIGADRPVVFWHTGGSPGLFAFEQVFHMEGERLSGRQT